MSTRGGPFTADKEIHKWQTAPPLLYCGEYGVIDQAEISDTAIWFEDIHSVFEKYGIARAAWTYKSIDFGISGGHYSLQLERIIQSL